MAVKWKPTAERNGSVRIVAEGFTDFCWGIKPAEGCAGKRIR